MHSRLGNKDFCESLSLLLWSHRLVTDDRVLSRRVQGKSMRFQRFGRQKKPLGLKRVAMFHKHRVSRFIPCTRVGANRILTQLIEERDKVDDLIKILQEAVEQGEQRPDGPVIPRSLQYLMPSGSGPLRRNKELMAFLNELSDASVNGNSSSHPHAKN